MPREIEYDHGLVMPRMAGGFGTFPICKKQTYNFRSSASAGQSSDVILEKYFDSSLCVTGQLEALVHTGTSFTDGSFQIDVFNTCRSSEEPNSDFVDTSAAVATMTISSATSPAYPPLVNFGARIGSQLRVRLRYNEVAGAAGIRTIVLSVNLIIRPA